MNPLTCAHLDCPNAPTHRQVVRTPLMPAPAFYYVCAEHATRHLTCCVCGESAGRWQQHTNRDTGFGLCAKCAAWVARRGTSAEEMRSLYGEAGVNYEAPGGLLDPHDPYSYADVTIGQTQHTEG